jgi:DNA invertase Pin-like site-specific DNA recombinase
MLCGRLDTRRDSDAGKMMKYGYARISSIEQNPDMQLKALQRAGCKKIFIRIDAGHSVAAAREMIASS